MTDVAAQPRLAVGRRLRSAWDLTHPDEDYADKWSKDPRLELSVLQWHSQASRDFETMHAFMDPVALRAPTKRSSLTCATTISGPWDWHRRHGDPPIGRRNPTREPRQSAPFVILCGRVNALRERVGRTVLAAEMRTIALAFREQSRGKRIATAREAAARLTGRLPG
jgi:hypothetical protein